MAASDVPPLQNVKDIWGPFSKPVMPKPHVAGDTNWDAINKVGNLPRNYLPFSWQNILMRKTTGCAELNTHAWVILEKFETQEVT